MKKLFLFISVFLFGTFVNLSAFAETPNLLDGVVDKYFSG